MDINEITMNIVLKMLDKDLVYANQYPDAKTTADLVCEVYKTIFKTVSKC